MDDNPDPLENQVRRLPTTASYTWGYGDPDPMPRRHSTRRAPKMIDLFAQMAEGASSDPVRVVPDSTPHVSLVTRIVPKYAPPRRRGPGAKRMGRPLLTTTQKETRAACSTKGRRRQYLRRAKGPTPYKIPMRKTQDEEPQQKQRQDVKLRNLQESIALTADQEHSRRSPSDRLVGHVITSLRGRV